MTLRAGFHGTVGQPSAQVIDGSLLFENGKSQYLKRTAGSGNQKTYTFSTWVKRGVGPARIFGDYTGGSYIGIDFSIRGSDDAIEFHNYSGSSYVDQKISNDKFRDMSGWYHAMFIVDTTESASEDKIKIYVNGRRITSWATNTVGTSTNGNTYGNTATEQRLGYNYQYSDQTLTQTYFIDGQALGPGYFGFTDPLTGTWRPKKFRAEGTTVNDGTQWSSYMSNASTSANLFDGDLSTAYGPDGNPQTFTPPNPIIVQNSLRIYYSSGSASRDFEVNDNGNVIATGTGTKWVDLEFTGPLTKISGSNGWNVRAIEVDGVIMVDSTTQNLDFGTNGFHLPFDGNSPIGQDKSGKGNDWTPVNFGGSNSVEKATGALPILEGAGGAVANVGVRTDANASNLFLALPLVGTTNDESNKINSGSTTKIATNSSVTASATQSNFYGGSHHWNSNTDSLLYAQQGNDLVFGTGDFTIEFWFYDDNGHNGNNNRCVLFDNRRGGNVQGDPPQLVGYVDSHNEINLYYANGSEINITVPSTVGKWWHYAAVRSSGTTKLYIDGVEVGSASDTTNYPNNGIALGSGTDSGYSWSGYIQDFRVYKTAKYTENFIPASTNPDILPDTPSGVSGGSKLTKITDGAVDFDATGDYLSMADSSDFAFGTGDFTAECFIYPLGNASYRAIIDCRDQVSDPNGWILGVDANDQIYIYTNAFLLSSGNGVTGENKWYHVAYVRNSGTHKLYVDGREVATSSTSLDYTTDNCVIGASYAKNSEYWNGFISNVRLVKGTALYTSNFTPPSAPLTNITNTKLLCCQSTTQAGDAAVSPSLGGINDGTVWSSFLSCAGGFSSSAPAVNAFNGDNTNKANNAGNSGYAQTNSFDNALIFAPSTPLTNVTKIEILTRNPSSTTAGIVNLDTGSGFGSNIVTGTGWTTVYDSTAVTLNRIRIVNTYHGEDELAGIKINDTLLLDPISVYGDASATTFNPFNTDIKTVRGQESGYATLNPLKVSDTSSIVLSDGNLRVDITGNYYNAVSTLGMSSGKFYCETSPVRGYSYFGIATGDVVTSTWGGDQTNNTAWVLHGNGSIYHNNATTNGTGFPSTSGVAGGYTLGLLFDADNKTMRYVYNRAVSKVYNMANTVDGDLFYFFVGGDAGSYEIYVNFGQKPFKFPPPDGFQPLNAANVRPSTVIARPDQYVGVTTYTGTAPTAQSITGLNFGTNPDLVWAKNYSDATGYHHGLFDTVRGPNKVLASSATAAEATTTQQLMSFDHNGFTVGTNSDSQNYVNREPDGYVAWCWKAGGNKNTFNVDDVGYASAADVNMAVGDLNSSFYNTSETWSNGLSALSGSLTNPPNGFNGVLDSYADSTAGFTLDLSGHTFGTGAHTIEVKSGGATSFSVGGTTGSGSLTDPGGGGAKVWTGTYTGEINSITSSASGASVYYVKIDGKILVNSGTDLSGLTQYPSIAPVAASVGTKQGFGIIQYQGNGSRDQSIPHGLTQAPDFSIIKNMDGTNNWTVFHRSVTTDNQKVFYLNTTGAIANYSNGSYTWWHQLPDASLFYIGDLSTAINNGTNDMISYHWHDVPGLQKFGSFEGNGNADGPFIELGFEPAVVILKNIDNYGTGYDWFMFDNQRDKNNPCSRVLLANDSADASSSDSIDFLSNGFKLRATTNGINLNAHTIVYAAWAAAPTVNLYGGQSNAR